MNDSSLELLIGKGIALENLYNYYKGNTRYNTGIERINQSISLIFETRVGESLSNPEFGSRLHEISFEPNQLILQDKIDIYVREALSKWEPRIVVEDVIVEFPYQEDYFSEYELADDYNRILSVPISVTYRIKNTEIRGSYSFTLPMRAY